MIDSPETVEMETNHFQTSWSSSEALDIQRQSGSGKTEGVHCPLWNTKNILKQKEMMRLNRPVHCTRYNVQAKNQLILIIFGAQHSGKLDFRR